MLSIAHVPDYHYVTTPEAYLAFVGAQPPGQRWAVDLETYVLREWLLVPGSTALDPHRGGISLISLSNGREIWVLDWLLLERQGVAKQPLFELLSQAEYLIAANAKFECKWLLGKLGFQLVRWRCVVVMSTLLANATGSKFGKLRGHSLQALCRDLLNVHLEKGELQVSDWWVRPDDLDQPAWRAKLAYAARDVQYLFPLHDQLEKVLVSPFPDGVDQSTVLTLEMLLIPVIAQMELQGAPVAQWLLRRIQDELETDQLYGSLLDAIGAEILAELGQPLPTAMASGRPILTKDAKRVLNHAAKLRSLLERYYGAKLDSVQAEILQRLLDVLRYLSAGEDKSEEEKLEEICTDEAEYERYVVLLEQDLQALAYKLGLLEKLLTYKKLEKMREMRLGQHVNPATGCIHSSFNQCQAATGRTTCTEPNLQQVNGRTPIKVKVPKHCPFSLVEEAGEQVETWVTHRHCFVAPPGFSIVSVDYKSQEMLIAAVLSGDELMLQAFSAPATKTARVDEKEITYPNPVTDLHLMTCMTCFPGHFQGQPEHQWLKIAKNTRLASGRSLRDVAKTINFGLIYLATPKTLAKQVYATEAEAQEWVRQHKRLYQGFWRWVTYQEALAAARGWARNDSTGRIRWVAEDNAKAQGASPGRSGANHLVQSVGADITKLAMVYLYQLFDGTGARLLKTVHDELVCLVPGTCRGEPKQKEDGTWTWDWQPDAQVQEWISKIRYWMERAESEMLQGHPGLTEAKAAPFWWH